MSKILIVDDDESTRFLLKKALANHTVIEATNGVDALEKIYRESPDIIFLDYMMPLLDGLGVMHVIINSPRADKMHVALITAHDLPQAEINHADVLFKKPFSVLSIREWADKIDREAQEKLHFTDIH